MTNGPLFIYSCAYCEKPGTFVISTRLGYVLPTCAEHLANGVDSFAHMREVSVARTNLKADIVFSIYRGPINENKANVVQWVGGAWRPLQ